MSGLGFFMGVNIMETKRIKTKECKQCQGTGIANICAEGGTVYCNCPAGEDAREYDAATKRM